MDSSSSLMSATKNSIGGRKADDFNLLKDRVLEHFGNFIPKLFEAVCFFLKYICHIRIIIVLKKNKNNLM